MATPEYPTSAQVRQQFIDFFVEKCGHKFWPSSRTIPHDDPTLLFANAGMNQFKPLFLGTADPKTELGKLTRAVNSQKCIRAGGKHNDLDDVGKDVYHHTFFEMLGNWSFANYFKEEAIGWAWELMTKVYGIPADRLYVTYFGGDAEDGLEPDLETRDIWRKYIHDETRIKPFGRKENFWEMGDTGPCGPCTEIHYDRIGGRDASALVNLDDPDVLELWNNVFMQFDRGADRKLTRLPSGCVDTGMGLERVASVLQNKRSNYDTDLFTPYFAKIHELTGVRPYSGKVGAADVDGVDMAFVAVPPLPIFAACATEGLNAVWSRYRVLADHVRTLTIAITDGGMPDSVGRGYVLRLILRRAVRFSNDRFAFGVKNGHGLLSLLAPIVKETLGDIFPELTDDAIRRVQLVLNSEEVQFRRSLTNGKRYFELETSEAKRATTLVDGKLKGSVAWKLYNTYGFPVEMTSLMAEELGFKVDVDGYKAAQAEAAENSKRAKTLVGQTQDLDVHLIAELRARKVPDTDAAPKYVYDVTESGEFTFPTRVAANILAITVNGAFVEAVTVTDDQDDVDVGLVLDQTNFYAEQGGQVFDTGSITDAVDALELDVHNCQVKNGYVCHLGKLARGTLAVGSPVLLTVDAQRRSAIMRNHTGTHIFNHALRKTLLAGKAASGAEVLVQPDQCGSEVLADKFRFDFTWSEGLSIAELAAIEAEVHAIIAAKLPVFTVETEQAKARLIRGLRFDPQHAYADPVRILSVGAAIDAMLAAPTSDAALGYSVEFCGGTHVRNSSNLVDFVIIKEESIAKGQRRVVAACGPAATVLVADANAYAAKVLAALPSLDKKAIKVELDHVQRSEFPAVIKADIASKLDAQRQVLEAEDQKKKSASKRNIELWAERVVAGNVPVEVSVFEGNADAKVLNEGLKIVKAKAPETAVLLIGVDGASVAVLAVLPKDKSERQSAVDWVKVFYAQFGDAAAVRGSPTTTMINITDADPTKIAAAVALAQAAGAVYQ